MGWNGLLVEGDPVTYQRLLRKQRRAFTSPACLSPRPYPMTVIQLKISALFIVLEILHSGLTFWINFFVQLTWYKNPDLEKSGINGLTYRAYHPINRVTTVRCIPLYTLLLSLGRTSIDFFSLNVEGSELDILQTIPFDKIIFKVWSCFK